MPISLVKRKSNELSTKGTKKIKYDVENPQPYTSQKPIYTNTINIHIILYIILQNGFIKDLDELLILCKVCKSSKKCVIYSLKDKIHIIMFIKNNNSYNNKLLLHILHNPYDNGHSISYFKNVQKFILNKGYGIIPNIYSRWMKQIIDIYTNNLTIEFGQFGLFNDVDLVLNIPDLSTIKYIDNTLIIKLLYMLMHHIKIKNIDNIFLIGVYLKSLHIYRCYNMLLKIMTNNISICNCTGGYGSEDVVVIIPDIGDTAIINLISSSMDVIIVNNTKKVAVINIEKCNNLSLTIIGGYVNIFIKDSNDIFVKSSNALYVSIKSSNNVIITNKYNIDIFYISGMCEDIRVTSTINTLNAEYPGRIYLLDSPIPKIFNIQIPSDHIDNGIYTGLYYN